MAIYYSPFPTAAQPVTTAPYSTATNDIYVTSLSASKKLVKTLGLVWSAYTPSTADNGLVTPNIPGLVPNAPPVIPALIANAVSPSINATENQSIAVSPITVYGGSAKATSYTASTGTFVGYTTSLTPALPAGVSWTSTFATFKLRNTVDGKYYLYNSATIFVSGTPTAVFPATNYTVSFTDASGLTANASFSLKVNSNQIPLTATSAVTGPKTLTQGVALGSGAFATITPVGGVSPLKYSISPALPTGLAFNTGTGVVSGTPTVALNATTFTVTVTDSGPTPQTATSTFSLAVSANIPTATIAVPTTILTQSISFPAFAPVTATGGTAPLRYAVAPTLPTGLTFSTSTGIIAGTASVAAAAANYVVNVTDSLQQSASQTFNLNVKAIQLLTSVQTQPSFSFNRSVAVTSFNPITANGGYGTVGYSIAPVLPTGLAFSTSTGAISGTPTSTSSTASYVVSLADQAGQTATGTFALAVLSIPITVTQQVPSTLLTKNVASTAFTPVTASGGYAPYVYGVAPALPAGLSINTGSGSISGTATASIPATAYVVTVTDTAAQSGTSSFSLTVLQPPAIVLTKAISTTTLVVGTTSTAFTPISATGGYGTLLYSIAPTLTAGLSINSATGQITGTPTTYSVNTTTYSISVSDQAAQVSSSTFNMNVLTTPFIVTPAVPSTNLTTGVAVTDFAPVTAVGGAIPYVYGLNNSLSAGLLFSTSTGRVSGTPTVGNTSSYIVTITDAVGQTGTSSFILSIATTPSLILTTAVTSTNLIKSVDTANFTPVTASGGYGSIALSVFPPLPTGLTFSNVGKITGIATVISTQTTYTVKGVDSIGQTNSSTFSITVGNTALTSTVAISISTLTQYTAATPYTPITYVGGTPPVTYDVSPVLPTGLSLNSSTGIISGTPTVPASTASYSITITDSIGSKTTSTTSINVLAVPAILLTQTTSTVTSYAGQALTAITPITASAGGGTFSYAVAPPLPAGLLFGTVDGKITGTPASLSSTTTYTVTVTDPVAQSTSTTFDLVVVAQPIVATTKVPATTLLVYQQATPFIPVTAIGGFGTLSYAVDISLPTGLTLNLGSGEVTGTPTAKFSTATYIITVTDSVAQTSTGSFSLSVTDVPPNPLLVNITAPSVPLTQNQAANVTPVQATGGVSPYTYSLTPSLPAGLTFDVTNGTISGTPAAASSATTYNITVVDAQPQSVTNSFSITVAAGQVTNTGNASQINNTANASSTSSGALVVAGGVGIGGNLYVGGTITGSLDRLTSTGTEVVLSKDQYDTTYLKFPGGAWIETAGYLSGTGGLAMFSGNNQQFVGVDDSNVLFGAGFPNQGTGGTYHQWEMLNTGILNLPRPGIIANRNNNSQYQWVFGQDGKLTAPGKVDVQSTVNSTSTNSGALTVAGGVGIGGDLYVSGKIVAQQLDIQLTTVTTTLVVTDDIISTYNTTASTSTNSGALIVSGGVGIGGNINVGGDANITGDTLVNKGTASTGTATGALVVSGGVGIGGNINVGGDANITGNTLVSKDTTSTSTNSGALIVSGGVGIGGNINVGGDANITGNTLVNKGTASTGTTTGALVVSGGVGIGGAVNIGQTSTILGAIIITTATIGNYAAGSSASTSTTSTFTISNNASTTSTTTGALVISGGVGIGGGLFVGGTVTATNMILNGYQVTTSSALTIQGYGTSLGTASILNFSTGTTATVVNGVATIQALGSISSIIGGTDTVTTSLGGAVTIWNTSTLQSVTNRGATTTNAISITNTASSTNINSGALTVSGGVGIGGDLNVGGGAAVGSQINSAAFTTNGQFLTVPANTAWDQTGNFTVEFWTYVTDASSQRYFFGQEQTGAIGGFMLVPDVGTTFKLDMDRYAQGSMGPTANSFNSNTWYHMAITGNGTNLNLYVNGVNQATWALTGTKSNGTLGVVRIGGYVAGPTYALRGNISNFRWVKSVIVYTGTFTPPTSPLTLIQSSGTNISAITAGQTQLLLPLSATPFTDSSTNAFTVTNNGSVTTTAVAPFAVVNTPGTNSISSTTGALVVSGGVGIQRDLWVGGIAYINGYEVLTTSTVISSTLQEVTAQGSTTTVAITILNTTSSTSTDTGALTVDGGVGIAGNVNAHNLYTQANGEIGLHDVSSGNYVGFKSLAALTTSTVWVLPLEDGVNGQALVTDGSNNLRWALPGSTGYASFPGGDYSVGEAYPGQVVLVDAFGVSLQANFDCMGPSGLLQYEDLGVLT